MNWMTQDGPDAPWNEPEFNYPFYECRACMKVLEESEALDPCEIEGKIFCDKCASNLSHLRIDGYLKSAAQTTSQLLIQKVIPIN